jgi:diaminopimelate epimerase
MLIQFTKYQALGNDFLVVESDRPWPKRSAAARTIAICNRRTGVGADGILLVSHSTKADRRVDVFNADGSWAEKSGNGLRIVAVHLHRKRPARNKYVIEIGGRLDEVTILGKDRKGFKVRASLGTPAFRALAVPVKSKSLYVINRPMRIGSESIPMTCLAVGNPHTIILVDHFEFDWQALGAEIEKARIFPNATNVEFVRVLSRSKIRVAEWERGAGATGSSGTGAAAAVAAGVMLGLVDRKCEVQFEPGSLFIDWKKGTDAIFLTGPVEFVMSGVYESR